MELCSFMTKQEVQASTSEMVHWPLLPSSSTSLPKDAASGRQLPDALGVWDKQPWENHHRQPPPPPPPLHWDFAQGPLPPRPKGPPIKARSEMAAHLQAKAKPNIPPKAAPSSLTNPGIGASNRCLLPEPLSPPPAVPCVARADPPQFPPPARPPAQPPPEPGCPSTLSAVVGSFVLPAPDVQQPQLPPPATPPVKVPPEPECEPEQVACPTDSEKSVSEAVPLLGWQCATYQVCGDSSQVPVCNALPMWCITPMYYCNTECLAPQQVCNGAECLAPQQVYNGGFQERCMQATSQPPGLHARHQLAQCIEGLRRRGDSPQIDEKWKELGDARRYNSEQSWREWRQRLGRSNSPKPRRRPFQPSMLRRRPGQTSVFREQPHLLNDMIDWIRSQPVDMIGSPRARSVDRGTMLSRRNQTFPSPVAGFANVNDSHHNYNGMPRVHWADEAFF